MLTLALTITYGDVIEFLVIFALIYAGLKLLVGTSGNEILRSVILVGILVYAGLSGLIKLADEFGWQKLNAIEYLLDKAPFYFLIATLIIFGPELRWIFLKMADNPLVRGIFALKPQRTDIEAIVDATMELSRTKTGALIVIQRNVGLRDYTERGITLDAKLTKELLLNLFWKNAPLHDGAVIVHGKQIVAAGCWLPLGSKRVDSRLGTRHRAAMGISEVSDAVTIVVSEERGTITLNFLEENYEKLTRDQLASRLAELIPPGIGRIADAPTPKSRANDAEISTDLIEPGGNKVTTMEDIGDVDAISLGEADAATRKSSSSEPII
ncbi:MAG: diadenylate cyclase [Planctomycetes bacterium]|nr:diadenylate cyclase [Planctomycetota bacterium]